MNAPRRSRERLVALLVLATVLFTPPLLLVAERAGGAGPSWLAGYLFVAWAGLIALLAWLMEGGRQE